MLCPPAVSASAAAGWLLAVLGLGLSLPAEDNSEPGFTQCSHCFYRQMPPQRAPAEPLLRPLCYTLPGGQAFASFYKTTCDTAVLSAFHLSHGWTNREREDEEEPESKEEDPVKVIVPTLLRGGGSPSHLVSPADSRLQQWDSTVTSLVQSNIAPRCGNLGGDLYILTGAGGLGATGNGNGECQAKLLWSAVCCAGPDRKDSFSVAFIRETGENEREVSVKELEEILGVAELFSEGCGGAGGAAVGAMVGLHGKLDPGVVGELESCDEVGGSKETDSDTSHQDTRGEEMGSDQDSDKESREKPIAREQTTSLDAQPEDNLAAEVTQQTSAETVTSEADSEAALGTDTNSSSTLIYIFSTTLSILKAPLHPLFSTITQLPEQVTYVLQEDLGVLSKLPGDTFSVLHLLTSDFFSGLGSAGDMLLDVGESCFSSVYYCSSCMLGALLNSCHTGITGMGTLAGDTVGIFGDALDNAWWVTRFFGGQLWEQSGGYMGTVMSEMGGQVTAVGGGLGRLVWRVGNGVVSVFRLGGGLIMGTVNMIIGVVRDPYGQGSD